jgi:hypothetical protein
MTVGTTPIRADGRGVFEVLRGLCDELTVQGRPSVLLDKPFEKIVRGGTGVIFLDAHIATRRENQ